jgi:hypothetical protein
LIFFKKIVEDKLDILNEVVDAPIGDHGPFPIADHNNGDAK